MTNEEAKAKLEAYIMCESKKSHFDCGDSECDDSCPLLYEMGTVGEHNEAINVAIKALSAEKTIITDPKDEIIVDFEKQTDGDLISRQAVIDMLNKLIEVEQKQGTDVMNYGRDRVNAYESILDEIESDYLFPSMPSAEKTDSVLEDIKAEIEKEIISGDSIDYINGLNMALMIINEKHISGKEE